MITRLASEIIANAELMSQIHNTDALSWKNKIDFLNNSYVKLYDLIHQHGDRYFEKEMYLEMTKSESDVSIAYLPEDFWKLQFVGWRNTVGEHQPIMRAPNNTPFYNGYFLVRNEIHIRPSNFSGPLIIRYIPKPETITYPHPFDITATITHFNSLSNGSRLEYMDGTVLRIDKEILYQDEFGKTSTIYNAPADANVVSVEVGDPYIYVNLQRSNHQWCEAIRAAYYIFEFDPFKKNGRNNKVEVFKAIPDDETGLELTFKDGNGRFWKGGFCEDSFLDYPNNIFFDVLTTDLALTFRRALDIPDGNLITTYLQHVDQLNSSLSRDTYQPVRINNIYNHRIGLGF